MNDSKLNLNFYKGILIWLIATSFYLYENLLQVSQSAIVPELMRDFKLNAHEISVSLGSVFLITYSCCQFPVGILLDRFSTRYILPIAATITASSCWLYANSGSLELAILSRALMGIGSAFAALSCLKLAASWFEHKQFAFLTGLMLSIGLSGSILGEGSLLRLCQNQGWRYALELISYSGFFVVLMIIIFVRDGKKITKIDKNSNRSIKDDLCLLLSEKKVWIVALYGMLMFTPFLVLSNLWGPTFIATIYNLDRSIATQIFELLFYGFIIGAPFFGWLSDYISLRKLPLIIASCGACISITMLLYLNINSLIYIRLLVFLLGLFTSGFLPAFSIMKEINKPKVTSAALGFMNTLNSLGAPIFLALIGYIIDILWSGEMANGIRIYSSDNFKTAFSLLPILYIFAIMAIYSIPETNCTAIEGG